MSAKRKGVSAIQQLPSGSDWDAIMEEAYVRKKIERGVKAANARRFVSHEAVKARSAKRDEPGPVDRPRDRNPVNG
jgi:hypothetical protein